MPRLHNDLFGIVGAAFLNARCSLCCVTLTNRIKVLKAGVNPGFAKAGQTMASTERKPIMGSSRGRGPGGPFVHFFIQKVPKVNDLSV